MNLQTTKKLSNGVEIPILGLGVFLSEEGQQAYDAVTWALEAGYRHIDTAAIYGNEKSVGQAIKDSGIPRKEIFLTTKLWNEEQRKSNQMAAFEATLQRLQMDYVDLYLIHWPVKGKYNESWKVMEKIYAQGGARAIGVSNFHIHHLEDLFTIANDMPVINQVECHPWLAQVELANYCDGKNIAFEPWSPLGQGKLLEDPILLGLAAKHGKTTAQVILRWGLQRGFVNIPKSARKERIVSNAQLFDFQIDDTDMAAITALDRGQRTGADPETFTF